MYNPLLWVLITPDFALKRGFHVRRCGSAGSEIRSEHENNSSAESPLQKGGVHKIACCGLVRRLELELGLLIQT